MVDYQNDENDYLPDENTEGAPAVDHGTTEYPLICPPVASTTQSLGHDTEPTIDFDNKSFTDNDYLHLRSISSQAAAMITAVKECALSGSDVNGKRVKDLNESLREFCNTSAYPGSFKPPYKVKPVGEVELYKMIKTVAESLRDGKYWEKIDAGMLVDRLKVLTTYATLNVESQYDDSWNGSPTIYAGPEIQG